MTTRLYYTDAYLTEFDARVAELADDGRRVYLDRTAFYPTSGGQPHDLGTLAGVAITDVVDEGERIAHVLAAPLSATAEPIAGVVNWERRFDHMQQHTGQHLLSAVFAELCGAQTVSVHFGAETSTLDLSTESLSGERNAEVEERANALVFENRPVTVEFEDASLATGLRKASEREGTLRIVTIASLDRSACGGTHVHATGAIGPILLRRLEKVRKATRVEFVCGVRAIRRARRDFEGLSRIATSLSAALDDAASLVTAQTEQLRDADNTRRKLERELAGHRARMLYESAVPDAQGSRYVIVRDAGSMDALKTVAQSVLAMPKAAFVGVLSSPPSILYASSEDTGVDAGKSLKDALGAVGGRGGGSPRLAQGSVPSIEALEQVVQALTTSSL
jgi:alanyl-tRNA synthetase